MSSSPSSPANSALAGSHSPTAARGPATRRPRTADSRRSRRSRRRRASASNHEPCATRTFAAAGPMPGKIRTCDIERVGAGVGDPDLGALTREFVGHREPDRSGSGAEVGDRARRTAGCCELDRDLRRPARSRVAESAPDGRRRASGAGSSTRPGRTAAARRIGTERPSSRGATPSAPWLPRRGVRGSRRRRHWPTRPRTTIERSDPVVDDRRRLGPQLPPRDGVTLAGPSVVAAHCPRPGAGPARRPAAHRPRPAVRLPGSQTGGTR